MWTVEVVLGVVVPLRMFLSRAVLKSPPLLFTASALVVVGVALNRINNFVVAYTPPMRSSYFPSIGEISVTVGFISMLVLLYRAYVMIFPVISLPEPPAPRTKYAIRGEKDERLYRARADASSCATGRVGQGSKWEKHAPPAPDRRCQTCHECRPRRRPTLLSACPRRMLSRDSIRRRARKCSSWARSPRSTVRSCSRTGCMPRCRRCRAAATAATTTIAPRWRSWPAGNAIPRTGTGGHQHAGPERCLSPAVHGLPPAVEQRQPSAPAVTSSAEQTRVPQKPCGSQTRREIPSGAPASETRMYETPHQEGLRDILPRRSRAAVRTACADCHARKRACGAMTKKRSRPPGRPMTGQCEPQRSMESRHAPVSPATQATSAKTAMRANPNRPSITQRSAGWALNGSTESLLPEMPRREETFTKVDTACTSCHTGVDAGSFKHEVTGLKLDASARRPWTASHATPGGISPRPHVHRLS